MRHVLLLKPAGRKGPPGENKRPVTSGKPALIADGKTKEKIFMGGHAAFDAWGGRVVTKKKSNKGEVPGSRRQDLDSSRSRTSVPLGKAEEATKVPGESLPVDICGREPPISIEKEQKANSRRGGLARKGERIGLLATKDHIESGDSQFVLNLKGLGNRPWTGTKSKEGARWDHLAWLGY